MGDRGRKASVTYPKNVKGAEMCIVVHKDGIKFYGNPAAFRSLAQWMLWLGDSKASEHYDFHLPSHLLSDASLSGKSKKNVWVRTDGISLRMSSKKQESFDVNFMVVQKDDLKTMRNDNFTLNFNER